MTPPTLSIEPADPEHLDRLDEIRRAAFAPIFASFRAVMGDTIYEVAQAHEDEAQAELLISLLQPESPWEVFVAVLGGRVVGFVSIRYDREHGFGEIGLNAVAPEQAGQGIGTAMYRFALARMKEEGMRVATVATGADPSHAPARQAYRKAGFDVELPSVWMCRALD